jgi:lipoprotein NlpD
MQLSGCSPKRAAPVEDRAQKIIRPDAGFKRPQSYTVKRGDALYSVAWKNRMDFRTLADWNGLKSPYTIYPGQTLRLYPPRGNKKSKASKQAGVKKRADRRNVIKKKSASTKSKSLVKKSENEKASGMHWAWPSEGQLYSRFVSGDATRTGIKISGKKGQKIASAESGKIVYVGGGLIGYGRLIIVKHNNKYLSAYGHNDRLLVKEGDQVKKGDPIATMGTSNNGKAMLHFEIRRYGKPIDPSSLLPRSR